MHEVWTYDELREQGDELRTKINRFRQSLGRFFVKKQEQIDLMTVAAVAQEPLLLVGPPGTAKSDLILKFRDALGIGEADYFEYMLTRFTESSEIVGDRRADRHQPVARRPVRAAGAGEAADRADGLPRRDLQVELGDPRAARQ